MQHPTQAKILFIDASYSSKHDLAVCGYKLLGEAVHTQLISDTSSTAAEIYGCIWALEALKQVDLEIYTDSQAMIRLPERRENLQKNEFMSRRSGKELNHADLYRKFYDLFDRFQPKLLKIKGHKPSKLKSDLDREFFEVDKAVRLALRRETQGLDAEINDKA